jgi:4-hydroxy-2-oxoheptanedioate aldolase
MSPLRNEVKWRLKRGEIALGVWASILHPTSVRAIARTGVDWVLFDTEHGPASFETVDLLVREVCGSGAIPLVRVVWNDMNAIKRALDTGALGVIVPLVESREAAENAVRYTRYPPEGVRGCAPGRPASAWGVSTREYLDRVNDEMLVAVQIETRRAVEKVEEIVSVEGVDATFIGPTDLSTSLGYRGEPFHPEVMKVMQRVVEASEAAGVAPGIAYGLGVEHLKELIDTGFRFIGVGSDASLMTLGCRETLRGLRGG